ncbi:MAG: glycosyltransferase [Patescibacteria group bacterium]|nr:glycosyltransferase [Patescibacteria group bacterium]
MYVHTPIVMSHLDRMTDSTGLVQHAIYSVPRRESGYTTDDNARALRLCVRLWHRHRTEPMLKRVTTYLGFLEFARGIGRGFHNFLGYDRHWLDAEGCGDCQGQAVRALAEVLGSSLPGGYRSLARELIEAVLPTLADLRSLRAQAYVVLAWGHLHRAEVAGIEPLKTVAWSAARRLAECYDRTLTPDWQWFESRVTYANAVLSHALFVAAECWPKDGFLDKATESLALLDNQTTVEGVFWPVGNEGWFAIGHEKATYDQQPVEAVTMADAALAAFELLGEEKYLAAFRRARGWFHGRNSLGQPLADGTRGSCCDGLQASGVNRNQGAESTLAYLWTELRNLEIQQSHGARCEVAAANA